MFALPQAVNKGFISGVLFQFPTGWTFPPILQPLAGVAMLNTGPIKKIVIPIRHKTLKKKKNTKVNLQKCHGTEQTHI